MKHRFGLIGIIVAFAVVLGGCGTSPTSQSSDTPDGSMSAPVANPPAVAPAVPTTPPRAASTPSYPADTASWQNVRRTASGLTYSYRYPPGWTADLTYCAPGAARSASGNELPPGCASTDILIGQKAKDIGNLSGANLTINGKQAIKQINDNPRNLMASRIYTVMLYDATGATLVGFSTTIGPGTDDAIKNSITATLDRIVATLVVGR